MRYSNTKTARFLSRPNRFVAMVAIDGKAEAVHVKNTGRCRELLIPGCRVYVQHQPSPTRKTAYDLIAVEKGERLLNMDANAPNRIFGEYVRAGRFLREWPVIRPETTHGDSRFDFYLESPGHRLFAEVKGVTLEDDGVMRFPDAPTERGVKHLEELTACMAEGYEAYVCFVIQMTGMKDFAPNDATHPAFGEALRR